MARHGISHGWFPCGFRRLDQQDPGSGQQDWGPSLCQIPADCREKSWEGIVSRTDVAAWREVAKDAGYKKKCTWVDEPN